jgi:hypothetical protein
MFLRFISSSEIKGVNGMPIEYGNSINQLVILKHILRLWKIG